MLKFHDNQGENMEDIERENQYIKEFTVMRHTWHGGKSMWVVKVVSLDGSVGSVEVISYGFSSFREAADKAISLFRVNIRNEVSVDIVTKVTLNDETRTSQQQEEEWPEVIDA